MSNGDFMGLSLDNHDMTMVGKEHGDFPKWEWPKMDRKWMVYFTNVCLIEIEIDDIWIWGTTIFGNSHVLP